MEITKRLRILFLLTAVSLFGTRHTLAATYAVGTCEPKLVSYSTISEAVREVPSGAIVEVCPGQYPEQVTINKPMTLEGITSGNSNRVIITVPSGGLSDNAENYVAQVLVTAGPVTITNIIVDGSFNTVDGVYGLAGIYFDTGSSGTIKSVTTRGQLDSGHGVGILASSNTSALVTIENCSVHDFDYVGILVDGGVTATIKANHVNASNATASVFGINLAADGGSITDNDVIGPGSTVEGQGITVSAAPITVSANTVTNWAFGIVDYLYGSYTGNTLRNDEIGIDLINGGETAESNTITQSATAIGFNCLKSTVKGNTINDVTYEGLGNAPSGLSSANTYFNVATILGTCTGAASAASPKMTPRRR